MKKTKVLFLARRYAPHIGGVETHLQSLNVELRKENCEITVLTEQDEVRETLAETRDSIHVLRIPLPNQETSKFAIWHWVVTHLSLFLSTNILHIHDVFFWILPIYPLLKLCGKKIFITFHGYEGSEHPSPNQKFWHQLAARLSDGNICIGGFHQKWYGVKPDIISFGAVDKMKPKSVLPLSVKKEKNTTTHILCMGRVSEDTGISTYLLAVKKLAAHKKISVDIFGDGPLLQSFKTFASQNHLPVRFHGFVPQTEILRGTYDVAFVSGYLSILECFAAGIPVIAHYNMGLKKDYILESPFKDWIVAAHTPEEITLGLQKVLSAQWRTNIVLAQEWAVQQTWHKLAMQYLELWG